MVARTRLLYLYPSALTDDLVEAILATGVPYFDLSLQHVSRPLLARMRRWGDGERFLRRIGQHPAGRPAATFRSSFILGYPGETEEDHDALAGVLERRSSTGPASSCSPPKRGPMRPSLADQVPAELALERLRECAELQDAHHGPPPRRAWSARLERCWSTRPGLVGPCTRRRRSTGSSSAADSLAVGSLVDVALTESLGTDLVGAGDRCSAGDGLE